MPLSRRKIVRALAGVVGFMYGTRTVDAQMQKRGILLVLDGMDEAIVVQYRGQRVSLSPQEIMDALKP